MAEPIDDVTTLLATAKSTFSSRFDTEPNIAVCAPGRVNLLGEHTDYNDGLVLPMALPLVTIIVGRKTDGPLCRVMTLSKYIDEDPYTEFECPVTDREALTPGSPKWANYVKGVLYFYKGTLNPFDAVIISSVPLGGGLSSSAALEVATYLFLDQLDGNNVSDVSKKEKALACQKAEHKFANLPCGIMDQFISFMGEEGNALQIDTRSLETTLVPMTFPNAVVLICNSNVRHTLSGTEYPERRRQCEEAAKIMKKPALRDLSYAELLSQKDKLDNVTFNRARHVLTEISRVSSGVSALQQADLKTFGNLMVQSHTSLRDDYEVSCDELNELVSIALGTEGVYGSRMTGGGFGGCTVTLVEESAVNDLISNVKKEYKGNATCYICSPSAGAKVLSI